MDLDPQSRLLHTDWDKLWKAAVTVLCGLLALSWVVYIGAKHIKQAAEFTFKAIYAAFALIGVLYVFWVFQTLGILGLFRRIISAGNAVREAFAS